MGDKIKIKIKIAAFCDVIQKMPECQFPTAREKKEKEKKQTFVGIKAYDMIFPNTQKTEVNEINMKNITQSTQNKPFARDP